MAAREPLFHRGGDVEQIAAADFWEVGASGSVYSRAFVIATLAQRRRDDVWEKRDFACRELADGTYLVTYLLIQGARHTRRATIWRRVGGRDWQAVYHQGTVVQAAVGSGTSPP